MFLMYYFLQKRGKRKGSIPLSSVKAVEFVDNDAFEQVKQHCFQVSRFFLSIVQMQLGEIAFFVFQSLFSVCPIRYNLILCEVLHTLSRSDGSMALGSCSPGGRCLDLFSLLTTAWEDSDNQKT